MTGGKMSIEVPGSARPDLGFGAIRRSIIETGPQLTLNGHRSLYEVFRLAAETHGSRKCLGRRVTLPNGQLGGFDEWTTYGETLDRAHNFGAGLTNLGLCTPNTDDLQLLGFFGKNRPEWVIGDIGCYSQGIVPVPMYDTLGADSVEYVVRQTELKTMFCTMEELERVCEVAQKDLLGAAILMDGEFLNEADVARARQQAEASGLKLYTVREVEAVGKENPAPLVLPRGEDVAFFCYTSGTTGDPKGALIRHSGLLSCMASFRDLGLIMTHEDVYLSYLPLPHVFERGCLYTALSGGAAVGFYGGETQLIVEDLVALRPTLFPSVPRLYNRIYDKLRAGVDEAGGVKKWLFEKALAAKKEGLRAGRYTHPVWDRLVFNPVKAKVGLDRARIMCTGSAPISSHVLEFLRAVFGCPVLEGYGQTESSLLISVPLMNDTTLNHVGIPAPCCEIRLEDVADMGYRATDKEHNGEACEGRGEICFRGPNSFKEYYRMPEKTAETIDEDGWVHTGDIGLWTPEGRLRIIDRKKNIFKLAQGEYVAAEKIENIMLRSPLAAQIFVYGDSLQSCLVAIIVPDADALQTRGMAVDDPATKQAIFDSVVKEARDAALNGYEIPKRIHISPQELSMLPERNGLTTLLTPTFKLVRNKAKDYFAPEIDAMYADINSTSKL
ncbi:Long-chain-fatty-acid--CoA ligase 1 [Hondaea fermentalgiana]|uniref:Long-chain-fatty-acid--CoA ligase 1 n=1 Tax=Hondaea fermentalgiana TaxID=2315210 RepID=A0A2R5GBT1_9STRA|nr:Long-chain-fatty-acid--CoA ligase 1 [Hondaea fermentalgiana]|eukprot:GBG28442.1 Long-chain-fatty-acid--CoA ligase 1 [Hondaea fermentalgiana]